MLRLLFTLRVRHAVNVYLALLLVQVLYVKMFAFACFMCVNTRVLAYFCIYYTVEPPNNGHVGDKCLSINRTEVVPSSEVLTCIQLLEEFVHCREVVRSSECPLSEVPLYL